MAEDIRISTAFLDHPKTVKLEKRLGVDGIKSLLSLWLWARVNRPCGNLTNMDIEDIEIAARWSKEEGAFVNELINLRWIDINGSLTEFNEPLTEFNGVNYSLHDWSDHNSWAVGSDERSNASRLSRMAKTHPEIHEQLRKDGKKGISKKEYLMLTGGFNGSLTNVNEPSNDPLTIPPSPAPAPAPAPSPSPRDTNAKKPAKKKSVVFVKPSLQEVTDYCNERRNEIDPQYFVDSYEAKGWLINGNKMKDWRAAVRTWEKNNFSNGSSKKGFQTKQDINNEIQEIGAAINERTRFNPYRIVESRDSSGDADQGRRALPE